MIPTTFRFRLLVVSVSLAAFLSASVISAGSIPDRTSPVIIDISSLTNFFNTLPPDEKDEQLRDWAAHGLKRSLALTPTEDIPIRHPSMKDTQPGEVSAGRVFPLSAREWAVVLSKDLPLSKPLIGGLVDRKYAETNSLPEAISLYSYDYKPSTSSIGITYEGTIDPREVFTSEYGYHSATVATLPELSTFMEQIDDIVMIQWRSKSLVLGGRKYTQDSRRSLTVEEIAALYQAYNLPTDRKGYEAFIGEQYAEMLRTDKQLRDSLRGGSQKKSDVLAKIRQQFPPPPAAPRDMSIGFSLDIHQDYTSIAKELEWLSQAPELIQAKNLAFAPNLADLSRTAQRIRARRDISPLLDLRRRYSRSEKLRDKIIDDILHDIVKIHSYQAARYDGQLQGTRAGMVLFYTDLLAKLWAMDYNGSTSEISVKGFRSMPQISLPKLYWEDFARVSKTRLWFGLRLEGFDVYGNKALFQPVATHVYSASSDPLTPGKESPPNYNSKEFLGWWDRHYEALAEHEPGYHKLNQIQKWSCIIMMLKEKRSDVLGFLLRVPVARDLDFETWIRDNPTLKTKLSIPFLDKRRYGRRTECLPLLSSEAFPLMGGYSLLSGGVSLATRKDILAKLHKHDNKPAPARRASKGSPTPDPVPVAGPAVAPKKPSVSRPQAIGAPPLQVAPAPPHKPRAVATAQPERPPLAPVKAPASRNSQQAPIAKRGAERPENKEEVITLTWRKSPSIAVIDFVTALAALQQANIQANKGEAIFSGVPEIQSVVRIQEWHTYLVKTASMNDAWIYLRVNPPKPGEYPAKAAGSLPEADIFCARQVTAAYAQKLAAGKVVVR